MGVTGFAAYASYSIIGNQALALLFICLCAVLVTSLLMTLMGLVAVKVNLGSFNTISVKDGFQGELIKIQESVVPRWTQWFCHVSIDWEVRGLRANSIAVFLKDGLENVTFNRRCFLKPEGESNVTRVVTISDPFGLFSFTARGVCHAEIHVAPKREDFSAPKIRSIADSINAKASQTGSPEGDRMEMREFQEGDSIRHMLWKVLAKTGGQRKMVRVEEKVEAQRATLYFIASGVGDDRAASFAQLFLSQKSISEDWIFGVSGCEEVFARSKGNPTARAIEWISRSGSLEYSQERFAEFENFLHKIQNSRIRNPIALVSGSAGHPLTEQICKGILSRNRNVQILLVPDKGGPDFYRANGGGI